MDAAELTLETVDGQVTILPSHSAYTAILGSGPVRLIQNNSEETFVICGGFVSVLNDQVEVLADEVYSLDEISANDAALQLENLEKKLLDADLNDPQSQPILNDLAKYRAFIQAVAN